MFCASCGRPFPGAVDEPAKRTDAECDGTCRSPLDPPRYCPECGTKLFVQVTPAGYKARCRKHGRRGHPSTPPR